MGNYKSRPPKTCSEELLRKIFETYYILKEKLKHDLFICGHINLSCIEKEIGSDILTERLSNGLTLLHLCCSTLIKDKLIDFKEEAIKDKLGSSNSPFLLHLSSKDKEQMKEKEFVDNEKDFQCKKQKNTKKNRALKVENCLYTEGKELATLLLCKGADPTIISRNGFSPLHLAAYKVDANVKIGCY